MPEKFHYKTRLVAFLDVLGMQTAILESEKNAHALGMVEKVYDVLKSFEQTKRFEAIISEQLYIGPLGYLADAMVAPPISAIIREFGIEHRVTQMSDSLVCSVELPESRKENEKVFATPMRITIFLFHIRLWALTLLEHGFATRGGIAVGNMYHSSSQAVGPALVWAYRTYLEAGYPRIAIEKDLALDFLKGKLQTFETIRKDDDGVCYLDVLAPNPWYPGLPRDNDKLLQIVKKNLADADDEKKIKAWSWMLRRLS